MLQKLISEELQGLNADLIIPYLVYHSVPCWSHLQSISMPLYESNICAGFGTPSPMLRYSRNNYPTCVVHHKEIAYAAYYGAKQNNNLQTHEKKKECSTVVFPVHGNLRSFVLNPYQKGLLRFGSTCIGSKDCCCIVLQKGLRQGPPHCPVIVRMKLVPVRGLQQVLQSVPVLIHEVRKYACAVAFQSSLSHFMLQILSCFRQMHKVFFSCFFFLRLVKEPKICII